MGVCKWELLLRYGRNGRMGGTRATRGRLLTYILAGTGREEDAMDGAVVRGQGRTELRGKCGRHYISSFVGEEKKKDKDSASKWVDILLPPQPITRLER